MDLVEEQLTQSKTIAVVGLSDNPERASYGVSRYMQQQGYRIIPVNPTRHPHVAADAARRAVHEDACAGADPRADVQRAVGGLKGWFGTGPKRNVPNRLFPPARETYRPALGYGRWRSWESASLSSLLTRAKTRRS